MSKAKAKGTRGIPNNIPTDRGTSDRYVTIRWATDRAENVLRPVTTLDPFPDPTEPDANYRSLNYFMKLPPMPRTRNDSNNEVQDYLANSSRKQAAYHICIDNNNKGRLIWMIPTAWVVYLKDGDKDWKYIIVGNKAPLSSIYPCYRPKDGSKTEPQMVLGLYFSTEKGKVDGNHIRSYDRFRSNHRNPYVADLTEDFFERPHEKEKTGKTPDYHYTHIVEEKEDAVALYVCKGAKLVVVDDLTYQQNGKGCEKVPRKSTRGPHCRSLLLPGSLVVVRGCQLYVTVNLRREIDPPQSFLAWKWNDQQNDVLPALRNTKLNQYEMVSKDTTNLSQLRSKVIFLGANDSQINSVIWYLAIDSTAGDHGVDFSYSPIELRCPEGGRIEDISSWNYGFEQIYWRHRYERLFESAFETNSIFPNPTMAFSVPKNDIIHKRILGISHNHPMRVKIPNKYNLDQKRNGYSVPKWAETVGIHADVDVRRYIGIDGKDYMWTERKETSGNYRLPLPPMHPPLTSNNGFKYYVNYVSSDSKYAVWKVSGGTAFCKPDPQSSDYYRLEYGQKDEYQWERYDGTTVNKDDHNQLINYSKSHRMAIDGRFYQKVGEQPIGTVKMWYLTLN